MRRLLSANSCVCSVVLAAGLILAGPPRAAHAQLLGFTAFEENDVGGSDSTYTQGVRLTLLLRMHDALLDRAGWTACTMKDEIDEQACGLYTLALGHYIYTPGDIATSVRQPLSRPYGGWLYVAPGVQVLGRQRVGERHIDLSGSLEVPMGFVGSLSLAEHAQSLFHWTFAHSAVRPRGWQHQLADAFVINPRASLRARLLEFCHYLSNPFDTCEEAEAARLFDVIIAADGGLGGVQTYGEVEAVARIGWRLPKDFGPQLNPVTRGIAAASDRWHDRIGIGVHAGAAARAVGYNRFVEGGGADEGPDGWRTWGELEPLGSRTDWRAGGTLRFDSYVLGLQFVWRAPEFKAPGVPEPAGRHRFMNVTLSRALD